MSIKDYYDILGVKRDATADDINKAFREKAIKYHPDKNPDDPQAVERFKECSEAFEVLNNASKRSEYDRFGTVRSSGGPSPGSHMHIDPFDVFSEVFGSPFGHGRRTMKGADSYREVRISLEEAYSGCTKTLDIVSSMPCKKCEGTGATTWDNCFGCGGSGRVNTQKGRFNVSITCPRCRGQGRIVKDKCDECSGSGLRPSDRRQQKLDIPAGIEFGMQLVIRGEGERIANGVPGDLICHILVEPHSFYGREGSNLHCDLPLTFAQSLLGYDVELPVFDKTCKVHIPAGTKAGQALKVRGMGLPSIGSSYVGDLLIHVQVEPPKNPTPEYRDLIKKMMNLDDKQQYEALDKFKEQIETLRKQQVKE